MTTGTKPNNNTNTNSILLPNGKINISSLEHEIVNDISNDATHYAQDEMKKRAIHTCQDYEEFENFVKCSQLKPVTSREMGQLFVQQQGNGGGVIYGSGSSIMTRSKSCSIHRNIEKRISTLMNDIPGSKDDTTATTAAASTTTIVDDTKGSDSITAANNDDSMTMIMNSNIIAKNENDVFGHILNLNLKPKEKKNKDKSKTKIKTKKASSKKKNQQCNIDSKHRGWDSDDSAPQNAMEFEKEWKRYCHSVQDILVYLTISKDDEQTLDRWTITKRATSTNTSNATIDRKPMILIPNELRIVPEQISNSVFKIGIDPNIMGDIIEAIEYLLSGKNNNDSHDNDNSSSDNHGGILTNAVIDVKITTFAYRWMDALTKCGRFGLNIDFLNEKQKQCIATILDALERNLDVLSSHCSLINSSKSTCTDTVTSKIDGYLCSSNEDILPTKGDMKNDVISLKKITQLRGLYNC